MPMGSVQDNMLMTVPGQVIEQAQQFTYLGSILSIDRATDEDINSDVNRATDKGF